ncbi:coproporphyrinogen dehydrogenase HemZ [Dorea phocaeensis]|uniref:coproporphyrinogen dehydrogenase HemZ n=1 Tax=Dorea phocaeensis TaxID=2040291 RepID=UPI000C790F1D|nr:coproporphyrinogen dehydrogenase HemZ [Dorea phocaeensis]
MIQVICKRDTYTYNAYHVIKAFYPSEEIRCRVEEKASNYVMVQLADGQKVEIFDDTDSAAGEMEKKELDRILYQKLVKITGRTLAWGILTGVRPTKLAMQKLEAGWDYETYLSWFQNEMKVSKEKAALAWEIAGREKQLLDRLDYENGYSLYVGIPFCPSVCTYCSFSSGALSDWKDRVEEYVDALCKELTFIAERSKDKKLNTIYIGGGTPTTLSAEQLERLLACIDQSFSREFLLEYTVEAGRPDSVTKEKLEVLKRHGITRISINPQSMQQKTLDAIGRKHTVEEIYETFHLAREIGFDNINMDLIAGLPGETSEEMEDTLRQIESLAPDSLTVHSLAIKRAAKMEQKDLGEDGGKLAKCLGQMIHAASESAARMGLFPYYLYRQKNIAGNFENVGYAKVDKAGIYNILIMEEKQSIVAAGAGASMKIVLKEPVPSGRGNQKLTRLMRIENVKAIDAYIDRIDEMIERKGEWLWR